MDVCGTSLWDMSLTWDTDDPDFTPCFHKTVLVYSPAILLVLLSPFEIHSLRNSKNRKIPWCPSNVLRLIITFCLIIISIISLVSTLTVEKNLYLADILSPVMKILSFSFSLILTIANIKMGIINSVTLFYYWATTAVADTLTFTSVARFGDTQGQVMDAQIFSVEFGLVMANFFLHFWADPPPSEKSLEMQSTNPSPVLRASHFNRITFTWLREMIWKGWKKPVTPADLWDLLPTEQTNVVYSQWNKYWEKGVEKRRQTPGKPPISIFKPLLFTFGASYLTSSFLQLLTVILTQISPQALNYLIGFVSSGEEVWKGYIYMIYLVGINVVITILNSQYFLEQMLIGMRIRSALTSALFRKSLRLSSKSRKERSVGETVNLMAIDTQRLMDIIQNLNLIWSSPLTIILSMYSLWGYLGPSCLAGLFVMLLLIPTNAIMGSRMKRYQQVNMKAKDTRLMTMNEILDGMKVLKLYAWEPSFQEQVENIRKTEVNNLKKLSYLQAIQTFLFNATPFFVAVASFGVFVLISPDNVLDAQIAFVSLTYFNIIRRPLNQLPQFLISLIQCQVSWERLNQFLNAAEINQRAVTHDDEGDTVVSVKHGSYTWDPELPPAIVNIDMEVKRGQLVAVVGQVGCGKSSLLSALTNDMQKTGLNAEINVNGKVSYVAQQAWMQNATLKYNITFGKNYNEKMYDRVIDACALRQDFEILPTGDRTEIGEKGINLSGGQKQRVSLARAVYNNGDIYLLDDPLSAVDAHVGKHIFEHVIGPKGLLKNKTRILVTHGAKYLPTVDKIIVLKDGAISEMGTYKELLDEGKEFADFLIQYIQEEEDKMLEPEELDDLNMVKGDLEQIMGAEAMKKEISKARSMKSSFSNISGYKTDATEAMTHTSSRTFSRQNISTMSQKAKKTKSTMDEKTPLRNTISKKGSIKNEQEEKNYGSRPQEFNIKKKNGEAGKLIEAEKVETKAVDSSVYTFYFKAVGALCVFNIVLTNVLTQVFSIGTNIWLSAWSDDPNAAETSTRNMYLGVYGTLGAASAIAIGLTTLLTAIGGLNASTQLHDHMLQGVLRAPMSFFDTNPKGRVVNRFAKDVDYVDNAIPLGFNMLLRQGLIVLGTVIVICTTNYIFIAVIIPATIMYWYIQKLYVASSRQLRRLESSTRSPIYSWFGESVSGIATIKAYGRQETFIEELENKVDKNSMCMQPNFTANRWLSVRLETLGNLLIFFAALLAVLGRDTLDPGTVGLSLSYAMQITLNLNMLIRQSSMIENNMVSVERIMEYQSGLPQERAWELHSDPRTEEWPSEGKINLDNLQVRYREGLDLVLKGIDLEIKAGEKVGIVGRTGSGKSSLTLSLFRINEAAGGRMLIDNRDISSVGLGTLRSRLTIIPQDPALFSGSLRMNLDPFSRSSSEELWRALELAHLKTYVSALPGGLEHMINEGGDNLSVGQRQLLCLARACLRNTKVIVLDEATAAVDLETDDLIQATIRSEFSHCTILTIAHRLNTIMDSDKIVVLSDGHLQECDSPAKLLANPESAFHSLAKEAGLVQ